LSKSNAKLTVLYVLIAAVTTLANLGSQKLVIYLYHGVFAIQLSVLVGTAVGLPVRYVLDKRYIFQFESRDLTHDGQLFFLYSFLGVFTTAIFWGSEYAFQRIFGTDSMRYLGGAIGLSIGYFIKYHLDKHFVFVSKPELAENAA
jgi:putative flippase GtrA